MVVVLFDKLLLELLSGLIKDITAVNDLFDGILELLEVFAKGVFDLTLLIFHQAFLDFFPDYFRHMHLLRV